METFFKQVVQNFLDFFATLSPVKKIGAVAIGFVSFATLIAIGIWASKTQYEVLYTELSKEDSARVAQLLEEGQISYQISEDSQTILVPESQVERWRLELAKKGVEFTGAIGYEVFDNQSFGTTSFVQRINRQRALEGELIKTINHIKGVKRSRVHFNIPESSPFVTEKKTPTASVVLELKSGFSMSEEEIRGVGSLVSAAVEGMRPLDVVIIDHRGKKLSENIGDEMTAETANKVALQAKMNRKYEKQIEEILGKVVGEGNVIAKVSVSMDFTQTSQTETTYDTENVAVLSEVGNEQSIQGSRPSPQGIPGARSNLPGEAPTGGIPETRNNVNKKLTTKNYNVPTKVIRSNKPTANLERMSIAVMVDGKRIPTRDKKGELILDDQGIAKTEYKQWSEAELQNFKEVVTSAVGLSLKRGDQLTIKNMEFATEDLSAAEAILLQRERQEILKNIAKYLMIGVLITLFFFLVVRPFVQWMVENTSESIEDFLPQTIEELEKIQNGQKLPGLEDALPTIEDKLNPEKIEGNMLREKIINLVEANPGKAAQVVHDMIHAVEDEKQIA